MKTVYDFYSEDPKEFYNGFYAFCVMFKSFSENWMAEHPENTPEKAGFYFAAALVDQYLGDVAQSAKEEEEGKMQVEQQKLQFEQFKEKLERLFEI